MKTAKRFENRIRIEKVKFGAFLWPWEKPYLHRFHMKNGDEIWASKVFTNFRCENFYSSSDFEKTDTVNYWDVKNPEAGCIVMAEINYVEHVRTLGEMVDGELGKLDIHRSGFAAFVFNGKLWRGWECPYDVAVYSDSNGGLQITVDGGLQITVTGLRRRELARVSSSKNFHELLAFEHVIDYCAGKRSLADILALVEMEERILAYRERQTIYGDLLGLVKKLKGAVNSKTAAEIERILLNLIGKNLP